MLYLKVKINKKLYDFTLIGLTTNRENLYNRINNITVSNTGVNVKVKDGTFKTLINSAEDYGKTVNYTVTVNGIELNEGKLYYHTDEYIYLILFQIYYLLCHK